MRGKPHFANVFCTRTEFVDVEISEFGLDGVGTQESVCYGRAGQSGKKLQQQLKPCKHSSSNIIVKIQLKISIHMKDL